MFGVAYIFITAFIAWRWRSKAAYVALPTLIGTVALFWFDVGNAGAYSSALWGCAGAFLIYQELINDSPPTNGEYVAGTLYGISGMVYIAFYLGASNATLSVIPIISDSAFILGLISGTWPNGFIGIFRFCGRLLRGIGVQAAQKDMAGNSVRVWRRK